MLTVCSVSFRNAKKRSKQLLIAILVALHATVGVAIADPLKIHVVQKSTNGNTYRIGDRIALYVEIPRDIQNQNSSYEIKPENSEKELGNSGWYLDRQVNFITGDLRFIVSPVQLGELTLPPLIIQNQNKIEIGRTEPWSIRVVGETLTQEQLEKPAEYLPPMEISLSNKTKILLVLALCLMVAIIYFAYRFVKKRKRRNEPAVPLTAPPLEADHVVALRKILELYSQYPFKTENLKPIAFGISEVIKNYFSKRFQIDASESTTQEMLALLSSAGFSVSDLQEIKLLFNDLDLIKFTKQENYRHFTDESYREFKTKSEEIIKKWSLKKPEGVS